MPSSPIFEHNQKVVHKDFPDSLYRYKGDFWDTGTFKFVALVMNTTTFTSMYVYKDALRPFEEELKYDPKQQPDEEDDI